LHYDYYWFFGLRWELFHASMHNVGMVFFVIAFVLTLWSGFDYVRKFSQVLLK
jgi:CDP-diacylglycerol--glycerol-3-phosphate 3-phosphatidyltransferase